LICHLVEYVRLGIGACQRCLEKGLHVCECERSTLNRVCG
jgi:hypothetical protein